MVDHFDLPISSTVPWDPSIPSNSIQYPSTYTYTPRCLWNVFSGPCRNIVNCLSWAVFYPVFKRPDTWTGEEEASVCVQRQDKTAPSPPSFFTQKYCNCQICVFACVKTFGLEKSSCSFCEFWPWGGCWVKSKYCSDFPLPVTFHTVSSSLLAVLHLVFWIWIPLFQRDTQCWLFL